jgi:hypothetical protein
MSWIYLRQYAYGRVSDAECACIERLLAECPDCQLEAEELAVLKLGIGDNVRTLVLGISMTHPTAAPIPLHNGPSQVICPRFPLVFHLQAFAYRCERLAAR